MTPLERAKDFRRRYAHLLAGTSSADWSAAERDLARAVASGDVAYLCALSEHLRDDPEPWFATQGERAFLGLVLVRTDESLRTFLRGADRPLHGWEAARPLAS